MTGRKYYCESERWVQELKKKESVSDRFVNFFWKCWHWFKTSMSSVKAPE